MHSGWIYICLPFQAIVNWLLLHVYLYIYFFTCTIFSTVPAYNLKCKNQASTSLVITISCTMTKHIVCTLQTPNNHYKIETLDSDNYCKVEGKFHVAIATIEHSKLPWYNMPDTTNYQTTLYEGNNSLQFSVTLAYLLAEMHPAQWMNLHWSAFWMSINCSYMCIYTCIYPWRWLPWMSLLTGYKERVTLRVVRFKEGSRLC